MYYFVLNREDGSTELLATTEDTVLIGLGVFDPKAQQARRAPFVVQLDETEYDRLGLSTPQAVNILRGAAAAIDNRASQRDQDSERSMSKAVASFNALYGHDLTEVEGWQFMSLLKKSRASQGCFVLDDYLDDAAYCALAGEAAGL